MMRKVVIGIILSMLVCVGTSFGLAVAAPELPTLKTPILITSCGQSPDAEMVRLMADRAGLQGKYTFDLLAKASALKGMNTLMLVIGGSGKGLGAAGINEQDEINRVNALVAAARSAGVAVVGVHIGGEPRRGPVSANFVPFAEKTSLLIVREDGNKDGYFTGVSKGKGIPLVLISKTAGLAELLKTLFT